MTVAAGVAAVCLAWIVFAYAGYPLALWLLRAVSPRPLRREDRFPPISVILAVHNGERALAHKLEATLAQDYPGRVQLIVSSDGSTDGSAAIATVLRSARRRCCSTTRSGRARRRRRRARSPRADGEILVFTDVTLGARARRAACARASVRRSERRRGEQRGRGRSRGRRGRLRALRDGAAPPRERGHDTDRRLRLRLRDPPQPRLPLADGPGERLPRRARGGATRSARGRRARRARARRGRARERSRVAAQGPHREPRHRGAARAPRAAPPALRTRGVLGLGPQARALHLALRAARPAGRERRARGAVRRRALAARRPAARLRDGAARARVPGRRSPAPAAARRLLPARQCRDLRGVAPASAGPAARWCGSRRER